MKQGDIERKIQSILWGKSIVDIIDGNGDTHTVIIRALTSKENNIVNYLYNKEIEKGKKAAIGEIRDWGGVKYRKTSDGWAKVGKEPSPEERAEQEELAAKDIADDENISIKNEIKNKLSNAQDFGEFLEIIDSTGQGTLEDVFVDYGLEYIDTPGDWAMEDNEADPQSAYSDIIEYYEGNVSDEDFTKLVDLWNDIKDDDKLAMLQFKKD